MKLLVIGGSGTLGREVLMRGVRSAHAVTTLVRRPDRFPPIDGIVIIAGDVLDSASVDAAVADQEVVISVLGTPLSRKPTTLLSDGTRNVVEAMKRKGVNRLLCVTGIGAGDSRGHGGWLYDHVVQPFLLREIYRDKTRQESIVRESGLQWVIVRPAQLTDGPATDHYRVLTELDGVAARRISRADTAEFLLQQVASNQYLGKAPVITN